MQKNDSSANPLQKFIGEFEITNIHVTGFHAVYNSVENLLDHEEQTSAVTYNFIISEANIIDSLALNRLIKPWNRNLQEVKVVLLNDNLDIIFNENDIIRNVYINGKIWMDGDSVFVYYRWDRSDTWSGERFQNMAKKREGSKN